MAETKELKFREQRFCEEYVKSFNGTQSYLAAGYDCTEESAAVLASKMLRNVKVLEYIDNLLLSAGLNKQHVLKRLLDIATSNIINDDGEPKSPKDLSIEERRTISSYEIIEFTNSKTGDITKTIKLKCWSKDKALENLGRFFKLFTDVTESNSIIEGRLEIIMQQGDEVAERYNEEKKRLKKQQESADKTAGSADSNV